jgi:hypothetical protein
VRNSWLTVDRNPFLSCSTSSRRSTVCSATISGFEFEVFLLQDLFDVLRSVISRAAGHALQRIAVVERRRVVDTTVILPCAHAR